MVVLKFGGTSLKDFESIQKVTEIIRCENSQQIIVVASASAGVTDNLIRLSKNVLDDKSDLIFVQLRDRHLELMEELNLPDESRRPVEFLFEELRRIIYGTRFLQEASAGTRDRILGFGELLSSRILAAYLNGHEATTWLDARDIIVTDSNFGEAEPQSEAIKANISGVRIIFKTSRIIVTQGYIGADDQGRPTTLGRGGSDFSAAIFGAALEAQEIQIWTDTNGILTADPRLIENARTIESITYDMAATLARLGAKVLHPKTIARALDEGILITVKNTFASEKAGTRILRQTDSEIYAVTGRPSVGFLKSDTSIGEHSFLSHWDGEEKTRVVRLREGVYEASTISLVGDGLGIGGEGHTVMFDILEKLNISPLAIFSGEHHVTAVVEKDYWRTAIRFLHDICIQVERKVPENSRVRYPAA